MRQYAKTVEEFSDLLRRFQRAFLKRVSALVNFLWDKSELLVRQAYIIVNEEEAKNIGLTIEDVRDIYIRLSSKEFEVFRQSKSSNHIYNAFQYLDMITGKSNPRIKEAKSINIELFPIDDVRNNNFGNFISSLNNEVGNVTVLKNRLHGTGHPKEPTFDPLNKVIHFGAIIHSFQESKNEKRLKLFKLLWDKREIRIGTKLKRRGSPMPPETIAVNLGMIESSQIYYRSHNVIIRERLTNFIKSMNSDFRKKGMPITIAQKGGVLFRVHLDS